MASKEARSRPPTPSAEVPPARWLAWILGALAPVLLASVFIELHHIPSGIAVHAASLAAPVAGDLEPVEAVGLLGLGLVALTGNLCLAVHRWSSTHDTAHPRLRQRLQVLAILTLTYSAGFALARGVVVVGGLDLPWGTRIDEAWPIGELWVNGYHLHHFFLGVTLLVLAGAASLLAPELDRRWLAAVYGAGLGIFTDEAGLLLTWGDYHASASWFVGVALLCAMLAGLLTTWQEAIARTHEPETTAQRPAEGPEGPTP